MNISLSIQSKKNEEISVGNWKNLETSLIFNFPSEISKNWLKYNLIFRLPSNEKEIFREIEFSSENFCLCFKPKNEILKLALDLENFLNSNSKTYRFEPIEPSFELILEKTQSKDDLKLYFWLDNGNLLTDAHFTWDALGLRFMCSIEEIRRFSHNIQQFLQALQDKESPPQ